MNNKTINKLKKFAKEISIDIPIDKMYLFGSQVKGRVHKDSDVDLLLVSKKFRRKRWIKRPIPLYDKWNIDKPVDFVCLTPEEFEKSKKVPSIAQEAVKRGIRIV